MHSYYYSHNYTMLFVLIETLKISVADIAFLSHQLHYFLGTTRRQIAEQYWLINNCTNYFCNYSL